MKRKIICLVVLGFVFGFQGIGIADNIATQTVTFQITAINELEVSGNPTKLIVNTATAGQGPNAATDTGTTYAITTNGTGKKITGSINTDMPSNTVLSITLAGTGSAGKKGLSSSPVDLVTGITQRTESGTQISYEFTATTGAAIVDSSKTVTLTLADG